MTKLSFLKIFSHNVKQFITFHPLKAMGHLTNRFVGLMDDANEGWSPARYWGTSGTTAPAAVAGKDPHFKYVPLAGLGIFSLMKSSVSLCFSLVGIAYV